MLPLIVSLVAVSGCSATSHQLKCPVPERGGAGTLHETQAQIGATGTQLGRGDENEITEAAANLRARHAGASKTEIVNYLVTAYCPRINARSDLDQAAKARSLDAFSARVERIVK